MCALLIAPRAARAGDPYLRWYTLETPHFRITYHGGLEVLAQRAGALAEHAHSVLVPALAHAPTQVVEILLTDDSEFANGSATGEPYDIVRLYATAPEDMSPLGDHDDWLNELITHEVTHIVHVDNISGIPALINAVLGRTRVPNQAQPRWVLEGLAVLMESSFTSAGRLRSTQFDMFLRADTLEGNFARLDQISNAARRWPSGNLWYLYGSKFLEWIAEHYGMRTFAAIAEDYGAQVLPWGVNRSIRRATGHTYEELYEAFERDARRRYEAQRAAIDARGRREGRRLTFQGREAESPRPTGACTTLGKPSVLYFRDDGDGVPGFYEVPLDGSDPRGVLRVRTNAAARVALGPDCSLLFDDLAPTARRYTFRDLFRQAPGSTLPSGRGPERVRLTTSLRVRDPDVSPDGRRVAYVVNDRGTSTLWIADVTADGSLGSAKVLVPSARYEQAYTPRFSPDGRTIAYGAWTAGGYRDLRLVDVATGRFRELWRDRALDQQPVFSSDGRTLYLTSDRSGVANVYAYDIESGALAQVTNVVNGAYFPEPTPDGRDLVYLGYTAAGWDLFVMPLEPGRFLAPEPYTEVRPPPKRVAARAPYPVRPYRALRTLRPRSYDLDYGPGNFGDTLTVTTRGSDIAGLHGIALSLGIDVEESDPQLSLDYAYNRLPFGFRLTGFRSAVPRRNYRYGDQQPLTTEHLTGVTSGVFLGMPEQFEGESIALSYTAAEFQQRLPLGPADPYSQVSVEPHRGFLGLLHLGYSYSSVQAGAGAISIQRGFGLSLGSDFADPALGSDDTLFAFSAVATGYFPMPWHPQHVLALALSAGTSTGTYPRRGLYSVGSFAKLPLLDAYTSNVRQGAFVLRGYSPSQFVGSDFNLLNAEYRFPLWYADRGVSTLPFFVRTLSGALFADYGGAFFQQDPDDPLASYHLGIGGELWLELWLGYFVSGNVRFGIAKGLDDEAPSGLQTYAVISAGF